MHRARLAALRLGLLVALASGSRAVLAAPDVGPTISVDQIRPGMTGYGLTVFEGEKPERFPVRVVAVMHNFLPKQDLILIRSEDPRLVHSGIAQGMSGSPIYIEDKLAGALAYGWGFSKDPLAGVTPIASMLKDLDRPLRGVEAEPKAAPRARAATAPNQLVPVGVPLQVSGLSTEAVQALGDALAPYHLVPQQAGGTRAPRAKAGKGVFVPGGSISVELIRGDVSAVGTGTVTAIAGDRVLAFGHPMFNAGEVALPIATAQIHTFMASLQTSFKLSSPLDEAGTLTQDRQSGVFGDTSRRVPMIPVRITVRTAGRPDQRIHVEIARHRMLTPLLAMSVIGSAVSLTASDIADATIAMKTRIAVRGERPLEITDHLFAPDGAQVRTLATATGLRAISEVLFNAFTPATIDRVEVDLDVAYRADVAEIVEASLGAETVEPGARPSLRVTLRPYGRPDEDVVIPFEVPPSLAGQTVKLTVQAGSTARPDVAAPENLRGLLDNLGRGYSARAIVVGVEMPEEGLSLHGRLVPELPGSVLDTLRPSTAARRADALKRVDRTIVPTHFITLGKQELTLRVRERR